MRSPPSFFLTIAFILLFAAPFAQAANQTSNQTTNPIANQTENRTINKTTIHAYPGASAERIEYLDYPNPLMSSSFAQWNENVSTFRFRIRNIYDLPTSPFRIYLSSNLSWFSPRFFTYPVPPDGFEPGTDAPYWDMPSLWPNESAEVSFAVDRLVGLPDSIAVRAVPLEYNAAGCEYLVPYRSSNLTAGAIAEFLDSTNRSQPLTIYYEYDDGIRARSLVYLEGYGTFAVFEISHSRSPASGAGAVRAVSDNATVSEVVSTYLAAATPKGRGNPSLVYDSLLNSQNLKAGPEHDCLVITGMDRFPCVDRESCLYACFSVPVCSLVGQSGWDFLDTLQDYNRSLARANSLLDSSLDASRDLASSPSHAKAQKMLEELRELNRAESTVIFHPLLTSYGFCPPAEYGLGNQMRARRALVDYLESNCLYGEEQRIIGDAFHAAPLLSPPPHQFPVSGFQSPIPPSVIPPVPHASNPILSSNNSTSSDLSASNHPNPSNISAVSACCYGDMCSVFGIERIGGFCWEWTAFVILSSAIICLVLLLSTGRENAALRPRKK